MESEQLTSEPSLARNGNDADAAARATRRYLDLLSDVLLDEHYLENEVRIDHLLECAGTGRAPNPKILADPSRYKPLALRELREARRTGSPAKGTGTLHNLAYATLGRVRLDHLETCLEAIRADGVEGDLVECGSGRAGAAIFMRGFVEAHELAGPRVWAIDRWGGGGTGGADRPTFVADLNAVREGFARFGLLDERVAFAQGALATAVGEVSADAIALLRIDSGDPEDVKAVLDALYDRVRPGGFVVIDGYGEADCRAAVDRFRAEHGVLDPLERVDWSAATWRKTAEPQPVRASNGAVRAARKTATKDLAVIVVTYNMRREASRTLHSLSRSYQRGIDHLDYEVIVVDNGSRPEERLGEEFVRSFGPHFRYIELGADSAPSPAHAINRGIAASDASAVAIMIDGAHVLTPGVLRFGTLALSTYEPAVAVTKQWYLGPGQQPQTVAAGYDKDYEDRLFAQIDWPADGYRLFDVGHFIGNRDWFDGDWESNCIFVPRSLIEQAGGMDESFSVPGGGFVNLDFFERMVGTPGATVVTILGEGSFHQLHGGTTTNEVEPDDLIRSYDDQYEALRGRRFQVPTPRTHFIGGMPDRARRTRPRHMANFRDFKGAHVGARGTRPSRPVPVPQDLKLEFIDAFWRSGEWHNTQWLGRAVHRAPTDLFAYQELVFRLRPDWIVETRTGSGGRALFLASICDLAGEGQVLSIDGNSLATPPEHPRIKYLHGNAAAPQTAAQARDIVGESPNALVILGGGSNVQVLDAFRNYAPFVPVGSYVVVEDTILQGNPVWTDFGPGPAASVQAILKEGDFVPDYSLERFGLTFNTGGYLRRVR
ncbi:MAG TPA: CmcI family methyltransferase [Thermoleophilaceae bacterium]